MGEALKEMAEVKYALEDTVKQNFLEPLTHLQTKDLKDVMVRLNLKLMRSYTQIFFSIIVKNLKGDD